MTFLDYSLFVRRPPNASCSKEILAIEESLENLEIAYDKAYEAWQRWAEIVKNLEIRGRLLEQIQREFYLEISKDSKSEPEPIPGYGREVGEEDAATGGRSGLFDSPRDTISDDQVFLRLRNRRPDFQENVRDPHIPQEFPTSDELSDDLGDAEPWLSQPEHSQLQSPAIRSPESGHPAGPTSTKGGSNET